MAKTAGLVLLYVITLAQLGSCIQQQRIADKVPTSCGSARP